MSDLAGGTIYPGILEIMLPSHIGTKEYVRGLKVMCVHNCMCVNGYYQYWGPEALHVCFNRENQIFCNSGNNFLFHLCKEVCKVNENHLCA